MWLLLSRHAARTSSGRNTGRVRSDTYDHSHVIPRYAIVAKFLQDDQAALLPKVPSQIFYVEQIRRDGHMTARRQGMLCQVR